MEHIAVSDADLQLNRIGSRFTDAQTQATYKAWSIVDRLPAIRTAGWLAIFGWTFAATYCLLFFPDIYERFYRVTFYLVVPWLFVATLLSYTGILLAGVMAIGASTLCMTGFAIVYLSHLTVGLAGGISAALMLNILYAPFMRLPYAWVILALSPSVAYGTWDIIQNMDGYGIDAYTAWFYSSLPIVCVLTVAVVNFLNDRRAIVAYRNERIMERQKTALELAQGQIRRYMPPAVAEQIIAGNEAGIAEPKRQRVTVMFCDIAGFTDMADRVEPEVMTEVLNEYMSSMADLIEQHGGTLNEFAGDGFMALFGAPDAMAPEDQVRSAVAAASEMQAKMPELNEQWRKLGLGAELKIRIGINTGMVSVGSYGSEGRMTYTAIGLQTNIASRIESKAEPGETLISDASYQLIHDEINCEARGEVECKGVHFPVKVYAPISTVV